MNLSVALRLCALGAACGFACTFVVRAIALRLGFISRSNPIVPQHNRNVAYLGGVGVALGVGASGLIILLTGTLALHHIQWRIVLPGLWFLLVGVFDDFRPFRPGPKVVLQIATSVFAVALGNRCAVSGIGLLDGALSALWIVALVNAYNLTDVCDGLVSGLAVISFAFLTWLSPNQAPILLVLAGVCAGFLMLNRPPASIFLGDAGSHLLGFLVAGFTLPLAHQPGPWTQWGQAPLLAGVPLFELVFLIVMRTWKGVPVWKGSPDHFSLRLQQAGLSRVETDILAWSDAALLGAAAILLKTASPPATAVLLAVLVSSHLLFGILLLRWEVAQTAAPSTSSIKAHAFASWGFRIRHTGRNPHQ